MPAAPRFGPEAAASEIAHAVINTFHTLASGMPRPPRLFVLAGPNLWRDLARIVGYTAGSPWSFRPDGTLGCYMAEVHPVDFPLVAPDSWRIVRDHGKGTHVLPQ